MLSDEWKAVMFTKGNFNSHIKNIEKEFIMVQDIYFVENAYLDCIIK